MMLIRIVLRELARRRILCSLTAHRTGGFTLLEMSIVLVIIGTLTAGVVSMSLSLIGSAQLVNTRNKLNVIEDALLAFRIANDRLPCPTDPTITDAPANIATFGYETGAAGACTDVNGQAYTIPTTSTDYAALGITVNEGAVPVRALGLPDEFQVDGWGRKFTYAVAVPMTGVNAFVNYGMQANCGAITVKNAGHANRTQVADYVLMSYGPNGHGGYLKNGTRYYSGSDNADEWTDCHCNAAANTGYSATYVQEDPNQTSSGDSKSAYDDIVRYKGARADAERLRYLSPAKPAALYQRVSDKRGECR